MTLLDCKNQQNVEGSELESNKATNCKLASFPDQAETKMVGHWYIMLNSEIYILPGVEHKEEANSFINSKLWISPSSCDLHLKVIHLTESQNSFGNLSKHSLWDGSSKTTNHEDISIQLTQYSRTTIYLYRHKILNLGSTHSNNSTWT